MRRCDKGLKNPNEEEKFVSTVCFGWVRVWAMFESSKARMVPKIVTMIAAVFMGIGIVIGGVFVGVMKDVMSRPAIMLPKARRVIGLMIAWSFSFIGTVVAIRVNPVWTSSVIRKV